MLGAAMIGIRKNETDQIWRGVRLAFGFIAGTCTIGFLAYGFQKLRYPDTDNSLLTFLKAYPPRVVGILSIIVALTALWMTMKRWISFLPGLFGYAVFGGLLAVANGGWHPPTRSLQLTRAEAAVETGLFAACCLLTLRLRDANCTLVDRIGVLAATLCFMDGATSQDAAGGMKMLGVMAIIFLAMATVDRVTEWRATRNR
jgi:hypothetical protein